MEDLATGSEVLTIEEVAEVLRISRGAYTLARRWRDTDGREGIPCLRLGRTLRVPRGALREMLDYPTSGGASAGITTPGDGHA